MDVLLFPLKALTRMEKTQGDELLNAIPLSLPSKREILFHLPQTPTLLCALINLSL